MKFSIAAVAALFALTSPAYAQSDTELLGRSQQGVNAGVPYPNPATQQEPPPAPDNPPAAAPDRSAAVSGNGTKQQGAPAPKKHKKPKKKTETKPASAAPDTSSPH
jgi:outer membrane biosynthesis protein TonB